MELSYSNLEEFLKLKDPITQLPILLNENTIIKISNDIVHGLRFLHENETPL